MLIQKFLAGIANMAAFSREAHQLVAGSWWWRGYVFIGRAFEQLKKRPPVVWGIQGMTNYPNYVGIIS